MTRAYAPNFNYHCAVCDELSNTYTAESFMDIDGYPEINGFACPTCAKGIKAEGREFYIPMLVSKVLKGRS